MDGWVGGRIGDEGTGGEFTLVCEGKLSPRLQINVNIE